jgi:hypothetical protein
MIIHYKIWDSQAGSLSFGHSIVKLNSRELLPETFDLFQNFPNPFNPQTCIAYNLSGNSQVKVTICNIAGQKVKTLVDEFQTAGRKLIHWDGTDESGREVASGIYFCTLKAGEFIITIKIVLLR